MELFRHNTTLTYLWPLGMERYSRSPYLTRLGVIGISAMLFMSCASGPKYGASKRKKKGCDCPHWNQAPSRDKNGVRAAVCGNKEVLRSVG